MQGLNQAPWFYHSRIQVPGIIIVVAVTENGIRSAHRLIPPSLILTRVCHFLFLLLWNIKHSSLHLFDSYVSVPEEWWVKITPCEHYLISPQVISQREKKRLSCRIDTVWLLVSEGKKRGIRMRKRQGKEQKGGTSVSQMSFTGSLPNNCLLWGHALMWQRAPATTNHQPSLKRSRKSLIVSFYHYNSFPFLQTPGWYDLLRGEN